MAGLLRTAHRVRHSTGRENTQGTAVKIDDIHSSTRKNGVLSPGSPAGPAASIAAAARLLNETSIHSFLAKRSSCGEGRRERAETGVSSNRRNEGSEEIKLRSEQVQCK